MGRGSAAHKAWCHFDHDADIGVVGTGPSPEAAFVAAAEGMMAIVCDPDTVAELNAIVITCEAPNLSLLFVDWLNALVFEMATRRMLFRRFEVTLDDSRLSATAWGEVGEVARHRPAVEIKGATYTALKVAQGDDGRWSAQCVVDV